MIYEPAEVMPASVLAKLKRDFDFDHFAEKVILISDHFENGDF